MDQLVDDCYYLYCNINNTNCERKTGLSYYKKFRDSGSKFLKMHYRDILANNEDLLVDFFSNEKLFITHDRCTRCIFDEISSLTNKYRNKKNSFFDFPYFEKGLFQKDSSDL